MYLPEIRAASVLMLFAVFFSYLAAFLMLLAVFDPLLDLRGRLIRAKQRVGK